MNPYKSTYRIEVEIEATQSITLDHENRGVIYGDDHEVSTVSTIDIIDEPTGIRLHSIEDDIDGEELYDAIDTFIRNFEKNLESISVRVNIRCISMKDVGDAESFHEDVDFGRGVTGAIEAYNKMMTKDPTNPYDVPSADWFTDIYYTNEDDGYFFYTQEDLDAAHEGENR